MIGKLRDLTMLGRKNDNNSLSHTALPFRELYWKVQILPQTQTQNSTGVLEIEKKGKKIHAAVMMQSIACLQIPVMVASGP